METTVDLEKAKEILNSGMSRANELLQSNEQVSGLIDSVQKKLNEVPLLNTALADAPVMFDLVKSYVKKEYTEVSPKVVAALVSSFLYLVKKKDLIPDSLPIIGILDDIAVAAVALKMVEPELKAFTDWKAARSEAA